MTVKKAKEFRDQALEELQANLADNRKKVFELRTAARLNKEAGKSHEIRFLKKEIARLLTVITEKEHVKTL